MKADSTTKILLAIIAMNLMVLSGDKLYQNLIPKAEARTTVQAIDLMYKGTMISFQQANLCLNTLGVGDVNCQKMLKSATEASTNTLNVITKSIQ